MYIEINFKKMLTLNCSLIRSIVTHEKMHVNVKFEILPVWRLLSKKDSWIIIIHISSISIESIKNGY